MNYRQLGKTGFKVSELSLGTWQVGGGWGADFDDKTAARIINAAIDTGVNFLDTADVYSDGKSENAVSRVVKERRQELFVATKCGRRLSPHSSQMYTPEAVTGFVHDSLRNMAADTLDLIQLHCPPTEVYYRPEIFETFDRLREQGKIRNLGVSVEKVEEGLKAIEYPNVTTVQIIFNMFRLRPSELFFAEAKRRNIGIIVRVPLASGLLSGKYGRNTQFRAGDHRNFNRDGKAFDKGETFSGVPYEVGLEAVDRLKKILPAGTSMPLAALRWILMFPEVTTVIPGASSAEQAQQNAGAVDLPPLSTVQMEQIRAVYDELIRAHVHYLW
ncbi:MAG TPA: aldo/keto reductase [Spirochaetia bacterium]|nr:aldo/keto reductase [Spirochaetia bacterium]